MKERYEQQEMEYARGKIAGHDVRDKDNNLIIAKGDRITDDVIMKALDAGELHYLMLAAAQTEISARVGGAQTEEERICRVEDYVRGKIVGRDVYDWQGNLFLTEGEEVTDDVLEEAEDMDLLQQLVLAVGAPGVHAEA